MAASSVLASAYLKIVEISLERPNYDYENIISMKQQTKISRYIPNTKFIQSKTGCILSTLLSISLYLCRRRKDRRFLTTHHIEGCSILTLFSFQTFHTPSFGDEEFDIPLIHGQHATAASVQNAHIQYTQLHHSAPQVGS